MAAITERKQHQIMYSKSYAFLFAVNIICAGLLIFSKDINVQAENIYRLETVQTGNIYGLEAMQPTVQSMTEQVQIEQFESLERVISYETFEQKFCINVTDADIDTLFRIVEAEAGGEDRTGKLLVADVVINRVKSNAFPNNVVDVVYQGNQSVAQFSPVSNGVINKVNISDETREVVYSALRGEDVSEGALFFMARKYTAPENAKWFDNNLTFLFNYGGHDFYKR